ncbi:hypothetical protein IJG98_03120 [Candidatus Saccharibacteria bacterium]|nr:hypothetical protein [Candidatus Saccharibacteria bacterium]
MEEHQEINETPPQTPPKQKNGSKIAIIILAILALAGLAFGIYGFFFKKSEEKPTQSTTNTSKTESELSEEVQTVPATETIATKDYIYIGEWGLKFKIPDGLHQISYEIRNTSELGGLWQVSTGSSSLLLTGYKNAQDSITYRDAVENSGACASAWIVRLPKGSVADTDIISFSIGEYDFVFGGWQAPCSDTMPTDAQTGPILRNALTDSSNYSAI